VIAKPVTVFIIIIIIIIIIIVSLLHRNKNKTIKIAVFDARHAIAMQRFLATGCVSVRLSVRPSQTGIMSRQINM